MAKDPSAILPIVFVRDMIYGGRFGRAKGFDRVSRGIL